MVYQKKGSSMSATLARVESSHKGKKTKWNPSGWTDTANYITERKICVSSLLVDTRGFFLKSTATRKCATSTIYQPALYFDIFIARIISTHEGGKHGGLDGLYSYVT